MKLRYQERALKQIETALTYIAAQSPQGAANVEAHMRTVLARIQQHPYSGKKTPISGVRRMYLTPYPYHIDDFAGEEDVVVQRFRHAARKPSAGRP